MAECDITWNVQAIFVALLAMAPLPHLPHGALFAPVISETYGVPTSLQHPSPGCTAMQMSHAILWNALLKGCPSAVRLLNLRAGSPP